MSGARSPSGIHQAISPIIKGERTFTLTPQSNGATEFTLREEYTGPLLAIFGRSVPDLTSAFEQFAAGLKRRAESAG